MKKAVFFTVIAVVLVSVIGVVKAQDQYKPQAKSVTLELQFMPFSLVPNAVYDFVGKSGIQTINNGNAFGISPRFYITDRWELRVDLLFGFGARKNSDTLRIWSYGYESIGILKETRSRTSFGLNLGANYHFKGTERLSPYVGALIGSGVTKGLYKTDATYWDGVSEDIKTKETYGEWYLNLSAVTGVNWYIAKGLYIGVEVGLGFGFTQDTKHITETTRNDETIKVEVSPTESYYSLNFIATPAIRLGWKF